MTEKLTTEEIISIINTLTKCVQFEVLIETRLFIDEEKIKEFCRKRGIQFRLLEDKTTIPTKLVYIRK